MPFHQLAANYFCSYTACSENTQFICIHITLLVAKQSMLGSSCTVASIIRLILALQVLSATKAGSTLD